MKVKIYALVGEADAGKSTTVSNLTGRKRGPPGARSILLPGGGFLRVWSKTMAWQEDNKSPADAVAEIKAFAKRTASLPPAISINSMSALMTLRFEPFRRPDIAGAAKQPGAEAYLTAFVDQGWEIASLVLFTNEADEKRHHFERYGAPTLYYPDATDRSFEAMTGGVRRHFGWA